MILDGSEKSLNFALEEFYIFFRSSGLKINLSETQAVSIGNKKYSTEQIRENIYMKTTTTFKLLGIFFELNKINVNPENNNIKSNIPTLFRSCLSKKKRNKTNLYILGSEYTIPFGQLKRGTKFAITEDYINYLLNVPYFFLTTNVTLFKYGKKDKKLCSFCSQEDETTFIYIFCGHAPKYRSYYHFSKTTVKTVFCISLWMEGHLF